MSELLLRFADPGSLLGGDRLRGLRWWERRAARRMARPCGAVAASGASRDRVTDLGAGFESYGLCVCGHCDPSPGWVQRPALESIAAVLSKRGVCVSTVKVGARVRIAVLGEWVDAGEVPSVDARLAEWVAEQGDVAGPRAWLLQQAAQDPRRWEALRAAVAVSPSVLELAELPAAEGVCRTVRVEQLDGWVAQMTGCAEILSR